MVWRGHAGVILATLLCAVLSLLGLDRHPFWPDEAITAIYSRNTARYGLPYAWDGRNLCAYGDGTSLDRHMLAAAYPWLQFYVAALGFLAFGATTFAGRLPFALLGVACVPLTYLLALRLRRTKAEATLAALFLACLPQFLLFTRQCRYYSLVIFFSLLLLIAYHGVAWERKRSIGLFAAGGILLFYSHFLALIVLAVALAACFFAFDRSRGRLKAFVLAGAAVLCGTVPWLFLMPRGGEGGFRDPSLLYRLARPAVLFWWYLRDLNHCEIVPVGLVLLVAIWLAPRLRARARLDREILFLLALALVYLVVLCVVSPQPVWTIEQRLAGGTARVYKTADADVRYAVALMPVWCILASAACWRLAQSRRWMGAALACVMLSTNLLTFTRPRWYILDYVIEFARGYRTSTAAVRDYLAEEAHQDDTVLIIPKYQADPLLFYLGHRLLFCRMLPADDARILPHQRPRLPGYVYSTRVMPTWIVQFGPRRLAADIRDILTPDDYERRALIRVHWRDRSRPELTRHAFAPDRDFSDEEGVHVYRRK